MSEFGTSSPRPITCLKQELCFRPWFMYMDSTCEKCPYRTQWHILASWTRSTDQSISVKSFFKVGRSFSPPRATTDCQAPRSFQLDGSPQWYKKIWWHIFHIVLPAPGIMRRCWRLSSACEDGVRWLYNPAKFKHVPRSPSMICSC